MKTLTSVFLVLVCLTVLTACGGAGAPAGDETFDLGGTWSFEATVTRNTTFPDEIGNTRTGTVTIIATDEAVAFAGWEESFEAERSGNDVFHSYTEPNDYGVLTVVFKGSFTSPTRFSGSDTRTLVLDSGESETLSEALTITRD